MEEIYKDMEEMIIKMFKNTPTEDIKKVIQDTPNAPLNDLMEKYIKVRENKK